MSKNIKRAISLSVIIVIIMITIISTFFIVKMLNDKPIVNDVRRIYTGSVSVQDILLENEGITDKEVEIIDVVDSLTLEIDGANIVGVLEIEKIGFHDLVYEGTTDTILDKGVGHIESSSYLEGNVCLAGHNTINIFGNLHTLESGDRIIYTSFLGTKEYEVISKTEIHERDWSLLQNTEENILTLITCIRNKPFNRLCVQAKEI